MKSTILKCWNCAGEYRDFMLMRKIQSNGVWMIRARCFACGTVRDPMISYANLEHGYGTTVLDLPILERNEQIPVCVRCGRAGAEEHHWAPKYLFPEDYHEWPTAMLCPEHHRAWHQKLTPEIMHLWNQKKTSPAT
jgi:hypothetical protein